MIHWLKVFQKRSQGVFGLLTLLCGFFMMWGSAQGGFKDTKTIDETLEHAIDIDPRLPSGLNNQKIVVAPGRFASEEQLEDEYIKPGPYLILRRKVEMFQWSEKTSVSGGLPEYALDWYEGQIDFFQFKESTGHENPLLRVQPFVKMVASNTFGGFDGSLLLRAIEKLFSLELTEDLLKDKSLRIVNNKIFIPRDPLGPGLGDIRISYEILPQGDYTILTRQVDERSLIGVERSGSMLIRPGLYSADELRKISSQEVQAAASGMLYLGSILLFCGLVSVLFPLAPQISLRPRLALDGVPALVVLCLSITVVTLVLFSIFTWLG